MKRNLFVVIAILLTSLSPSAIHAEDEKATAAYQTTIGATSAQGALVTFFAVNTLRDAFSKEAINAESALQIAAVYESTATAASATLKKLRDEVEFSEEDGEYLDNIVKLYDTMSKQAKALTGLIEEDEGAADTLEANRQKAGKLIEEIFGDSVLGDVGGG